MIALYVLFRDGVADEDRRRLFQHARLSLSEQEAVNNLVYLGAKVVKVGQGQLGRSPLTSCTGCEGSIDEDENKAEIRHCRRRIRAVTI